MTELFSSTETPPQVCRVEGSMDFSCGLDGSRESVKRQVGGIALAPVSSEGSKPIPCNGRIGKRQNQILKKLI